MMGITGVAGDNWVVPRTVETVSWALSTMGGILLDKIEQRGDPQHQHDQRGPHHHASSASRMMKTSDDADPIGGAVEIRE
jgi:hypothetical protein